MSDPRDLAALLRAVEDGRARLDALVARVPAARLAEPALHDGWSVKDVLAHVSYWEEQVAAHLDAAARGEPGPPGDEDFDAVNRRVREARRALPLETVRQDAARAYRGVLARLRALDGAALDAPAPGAAAGAPTLRELVAGSTSDHYAEHADTLEAWLARGAPGPA
jgi:uncharacterized protein (TIGR03083 family)